MDKFDQRIDNIKNEFLLTEADEARGLSALAQMIGNLSIPNETSYSETNVYYLVDKKYGNETALELLKKSIKYDIHNGRVSNELNKLTEERKKATTELSQAKRSKNDVAEAAAQANYDEAAEKLKEFENPFRDDGTLKVAGENGQVVDGESILRVNFYKSFLGAITEQKRRYFSMPELINGTLRGRASYTREVATVSDITGTQEAHKQIMNMIKSMGGKPEIKYLDTENASKQQKKEAKGSLWKQAGQGLLNVASKGVEIN